MRTRVVIEQTFGILKRRFPCLSCGLRVKPGRSCQIIMSCSYLHNFGLDHGDIFDRLTGVDVDQPEPDLNIQVANPNNGLLYRDVLARTFFS